MAPVKVVLAPTIDRVSLAPLTPFTVTVPPPVSPLIYAVSPLAALPITSVAPVAMVRLLLATMEAPANRPSVAPELTVVAPVKLNVVALMTCPAIWPELGVEAAAMVRPPVLAVVPVL